MSDRAFRGVWIPKEVWLSKDMSALEKCLLVEIDSLDSGPKHCYASNDFLAAFLDCSVSTISRGITKLVRLGLLESIQKRTPTGTERVLKSLLSSKEATGQNDETPTKGTNQNDQTPPSQNDQHSIDLPLGDLSNTVEIARPRKEQKHRHGEYNHVLLTSSELDRLKQDFPLDWEERITRLDEYIQMKGVSYKDHNLTIRNWAKKDQSREPEILTDEQRRAMIAQSRKNLGIA